MFPGARDIDRTVSIGDEEVEGVGVAGVGEAVVPRRQPVQALRGDVPEVARVGRVLRHHHRAPRHHRVDQRSLRRLRHGSLLIPSLFLFYVAVGCGYLLLLRFRWTKRMEPLSLVLGNVFSFVAKESVVFTMYACLIRINPGCRD